MEQWIDGVNESKESLENIRLLISDMDEISRDENVNKLVRIAFLRFSTDLQFECARIKGVINMIEDTLKEVRNGKRVQTVTQG